MIMCGCFFVAIVVVLSFLFVFSLCFLSSISQKLRIGMYNLNSDDYGIMNLIQMLSI